MKPQVVYSGAGYVGLTGAIAFARAGVPVVCYDPDPEVVRLVNAGKTKIPNLESFLQFEWGYLVEDGLLRATTDFEEILKVPVHLLAVPTERDGEAHMGIVVDVVETLAKRIQAPELTIIVESTLTPGWAEWLAARARSLASVPVYFAAAPRRDFFADPKFDLRRLTRVVGGIDAASTDRAVALLSKVSESLMTTTAELAELSKSLENSLLHVPVMYLIELSRLYQHLDFGEALRLACTHWRIPNYFLDLAVSGYCVPLGTRYVVNGARGRATLGLRAIEAEAEHTVAAADWLERWSKGEPVGFFGLSYKADFKVPHLSATARLLQWLPKTLPDVFVHDPYFSPTEIEKLGAKWFSPDDMCGVKTLVLATAHRLYRDLDRAVWIKVERLLDVHGILEAHRGYIKRHGVDYRRLGEKWWML